MELFKTLVAYSFLAYFAVLIVKPKWIMAINFYPTMYGMFFFGAIIHSANYIRKKFKLGQ